MDDKSFQSKVKVWEAWVIIILTNNMFTLFLPHYKSIAVWADYLNFSVTLKVQHEDSKTVIKT